MSTYPNLKNEDPTLLKITTKDDEIKDLKYKTEKPDHEIFLKSLKIDKEYYKKKQKSFKKRRFFNYHENLIGPGTTLTSSILSLNNPSVGNVISGSTALLTSIAILSTNENISKLNFRYTKLRD